MNTEQADCMFLRSTIATVATSGLFYAPDLISRGLCTLAQVTTRSMILVPYVLEQPSPCELLPQTRNNQYSLKT